MGRSSWALLLLLANPVVAAQRMVVEAEDFDGLPYFSYHNLRAAGWYAREANCRSFGTLWGNGKVAIIHETAKQRTMAFRLPKPLPPGRYRVGVRVAGTVMAERLGRDNVLRIEVGAASTDFRWRNAGRRPTWLPLQEVVLEQPTETLRATAVAFGGGGFGHLNEPQAATICLDTLYLTNDPAEIEPPTPEREREVKFGTAVLPLPSESRPLWHARFEPPGQFTLLRIRLEAADGRRNLFPDGSFELGMNAGWAATNMAYTYCYLFTDGDLDHQNPAHGRTCLRVPAGASPFSRPLFLEQGGPLTLSLSLRSEAPQVATVELRGQDDQPLLSQRCEVASAWKRFSVSGEVPAGWLSLSLQNPQTLWVDAIQLERGGLTDFQPRAVLEGGFSTGELGNVLPDDRRELRLWFHNSSPTAQQARMHYRIVDLWERVVAEGATEPVNIPPRETVCRPFPLPMSEQGIFSLTYAVEDRPMPEGEIVFVCLPAMPQGPVHHELGANMDVLEHAYHLHQRLGFRWQLYCKFFPTMPQRAQPEEGEWQWFDESVALAEKCGLKTLPCLWPSRPQPFFGDPTKVPGETMGLTRNTSRAYKPGVPVYPRLDAWRDYVRSLAAHYKAHLRSWCIEDETELYFTPADFAPILRATREALQSVDPHLKVGTSLCPQYHEELLRLVGDQVDFLAGSTWEASYWEARKIRLLQERTGKPWYCIGVGMGTPRTFYHTLPQASPALADAAVTAQQLVKLCLVQDAKVVGHYTGRIWNKGQHTSYDFPLVDYDGTPLPHGAIYASVGRLLANAVPVGEVKIPEPVAGEGSAIAFLFEQEGRVHAVTWSGAPGGLHGHNLGPLASHGARRTLTLRLSQEDVRLTDPFGNPWPEARWEGGRLFLTLTPMPVFLWNQTLSKEALTRALAEGEFAKDSATGRIAVAPHPGDPNRLDLLVTLRWPRLRGDPPDAVEIGTAPGQLMTDNQWLLDERYKAIGRSQWRNHECTVRLSTVLHADRLRHPLENAQLYAWVLRKGEVVGGVNDALWIARADRIEGVALDGNLDEWQGRSAAWLDYSFSWARFGRWLEQVEEGGEHFSEFFSDADTTDARVGFWCAHDGNACFVAARIYDDQPMEGDTVILHLGKTPPISVPLREGRVSLSPGEAAVRRLTDGWALEARFSRRALRAAGQPMLAFDLHYQDVDSYAGQQTVGVLRWAGMSRGGWVWLR